MAKPTSTASNKKNSTTGKRTSIGRYCKPTNKNKRRLAGKVTYRGQGK